jgi:hypothetical protein
MGWPPRRAKRRRGFPPPHVVMKGLRYLWALPASAVGAAIGLLALLHGARVQWHSGVLECTLGAAQRRAAHRAHRFPFAAITLGHVVLAATAEEQSRLRRHERVHVAQYERWGPLLLLAYPAESLWQWLRGRRPYFDNRFEQEAFRVAGGDKACEATEMTAG